jgi:predicted N-acetyltransferase YhbS
MPITIRPTRVPDISALQAIEAAGEARFRAIGMFADRGGPLPVETQDDHRRAIAGGLSFCADAEGQIVGFITGRMQADEAYLEQVDVLESHGRRGIGAALVGHFGDAARSLGARGVVLSTFRDVAWNGPFYARLGFEEIARADLTPWMLEIEAGQRPFLDVSRRCFMRRALP